MIFNLTFLCHRFRLFLAVKIFSLALFYHRFRVFLAVSFWNKKFCCLPRYLMLRDVAEYFIVPINQHTTAF